MEGLSNYEQWKIAHQSSRRPSGTSIVALGFGAAALIVGVGAGVMGCSRAKAAEKYADAKYDGLREMIYMQSKNIDGQTNLIAAERAERIEGDRTLSISINDTVSGQQQGSLSQSQQLSNEISLGLMTGKYSENPQKVMLYSAPQPCGCPNQCGR